jgi:translation initiation factor IF-3
MPRTRINGYIRVPEIRCIGHDGEQIGVIPTREAQRMAREMGLDLVEVSPTARPPVCRIMDYGKFKYDRDKKERQAKKHQTNTKQKEIKFHANVGEHDYQTKLRHAIEFLEEGHRVKFSLYFRGRENAHQELGYELMQRVAADLAEHGTLEQTARKMGRSLIMMMVPKKK